MGRPKSTNPKCNRLELRLTADELEEVQYIAQELGVSMSDAIRDAIYWRSEEIYQERQKSRPVQ